MLLGCFGFLAVATGTKDGRCTLKSGRLKCPLPQNVYTPPADIDPETQGNKEARIVWYSDDVGQVLGSHRCKLGTCNVVSDKALATSADTHAVWFKQSVRKKARTQDMN